MLAFHRSHGDPFTMLLFRAPNPSACGIAELDDEGRVVSFVEKPKEPKSDLANGGVYVVDADAYREIAAMKAFDLGFEVLPRFVGRMRGWPWEGYHLDVGTLEALEKARRDAPGLLERPAAAATGTRPAVFLDRDGTMIEHVHYLSDPAEVRLLPGAPEALRRLQAAGFAAGDRHQPVGDRPGDAHRRSSSSWSTTRWTASSPPRGRRWTGSITAPRPRPATTGRRSPTATASRARGCSSGPRPTWASTRRASWMVGDMISDVLAGINAGCRGSILVRTGKGLDRGRGGPAPRLPGRPRPLGRRRRHPGRPAGDGPDTRTSESRDR